jgi:uncharacterized Zn finger protein
MSWSEFPPAKPRKADGIVAKSKRGAIGATWWSQRFLTVLEGFGLGTRLTRGRSYARSGQVLEVVVRPGEVLASVQGSERKPYNVVMDIDVFQPEQWARVERRLAASAQYCAELLAGRMPEDIETVFGDSNLTLFPTSREFDTDCTCPDWQNPCKHIAATCYILAERFDQDPFLILAWRGRSRAELLRRIETYRDDAAWEQADREPQQPPLDELVGVFWDCPAPLPELPGRGPVGADSTDSADSVPVAATAAGSALGAVPVGAILDRLGPLGVELRGSDLADLLRPAYEAMSRR